MSQRLSAAVSGPLLQTLEARFAAHPERHAGLRWPMMRERLEGDPGGLWALQQMEASGGEPDLIGVDPASGTLLYVDCAAESPAGRRSLCFDEQALAERKANKPAGSAVAMAAALGIELLDEQHYRALQALGEFDLKTSSWIQTPETVRQLGGALFCDRRFGRVFTYHNGAQSYYAARGFRGLRRI
ncbi:MAG: DUF4256 domain-containing protein [Xanthomonadales bacterium]|nr:DUF4256 domain-containing protein [Xanthomonadales bacterium]